MLAFRSAGEPMMVCPHLVRHMDSVHLMRQTASSKDLNNLVAVSVHYVSHHHSQCGTCKGSCIVPCQGFWESDMGSEELHILLNI